MQPAGSNEKNRMDIPLLFATRILRLFCYGFLSVVLALYLIDTGLAVNHHIMTVFHIAVINKQGINSIGGNLECAIVN